METIPEQQLVARARRGDVEAFEAILGPSITPAHKYAVIDLQTGLSQVLPVPHNSNASLPGNRRSVNLPNQGGGFIASEHG